MGALCCRPQVIDFDADVNLFHFMLLRCVGKGAFGKVRVVQHKQTRDLYALKYINKTKCVRMKAVANVIQERRLLEEIDHPFVVNLRYAFQDDENFHLDRLGSLPEETVKFYIAELSSAVCFLHDKHIMHRDIKPDNILLDERGHAHLTDFNIAVHFSERRLLTGVAGSMAYMAPEILHKRGYTYPIDWWSLGVCAYELLFGRRPYRGRTNTALTQSISKDPLRFPENAGEKCSTTGINFVSGLLERDPYKRVACSPQGDSLDEIHRHPWFNSLDWVALDRKEIPSPFVPDSKKANFDASHELEELLLEDNPLKAKARKQNRDINSLSAEMRQMEEQFTIYDFRAMRRRSYYPHNQQIVTTVTATSSSGMVASRPVTPGDMINGRSDDIVLDSQFIPGVRDELEGHSSESHHHPPVHIGEKGKENV
ncbi:kinase-like domain-containing protein [Russula aff. rugulosa BPL654]|nr:kinase-like domain-containing protein [Russula aff. rugulosa BPL654]